MNWPPLSTLSPSVRWMKGAYPICSPMPRNAAATCVSTIDAPATVVWDDLRHLTASAPVPHLGLPGNPVSAMMTFELFGRAALAIMLGRNDWERPTIRATVRQRVVNTDPRRFYGRCFVTRGEDGRWYADLTGPQGSNILTSMSAANGLTVIPETVEVVEAGGEIDVMMLDWEHAP